MAGINIPGVTNQYNTNETVEKLMKIERIPLTREQNALESLKTEKDAWRDLNSKLSSLRDNSKTLYSFENPFNNKITSSTEEYAITADANRSASIQSFKVDVIQPATPDRFLSSELDSDYKVQEGTFTFKAGEKQLSFKWKGGSLKDFANAINKRGNNIIKASIIGASEGKKTLLIEAVKTGKENRLIFEDDAYKMAFDIKMIDKIKSKAVEFADEQKQILPVNKIEYEEPSYMPKLSLTNIKFNEEDKTVRVEPRGAYQVKIPEKILSDSNIHIQFSITPENTEDITSSINEKLMQPELPSAGNAEFEGIIVNNSLSDVNMNLPPVPPEPLSPVTENQIVFAVMEDGTEKPVEVKDLFSIKENDSETSNLNNSKYVDINLSEYKGIKSIAIRNTNTGTAFTISDFSALNPVQDLGYGPVNPVSVADDAIIKYEGITISRPSNKIDDVVPEITLNLHDKTEKTATISVKPDKESSKNTIIEFVGKYNQAIAELNILSQKKPEIIQELNYLTKEEQEEKGKKLGIFQSDFSLTNIKSNMASIISQNYVFSDTAKITMLSQIGIATNAGGFSGGYSQSKLRGYLEIDEKKLDAALDSNMDDIRQLFGYDTDGDLIIDSGIAYRLDKQISAYTQTGGILSLKTSTLDSKIKSSEQKISKLETQMNNKEAQLRSKYSQMEGSLNSLEAQQNTISNFTKQQNNKQ